MKPITMAAGVVVVRESDEGWRYLLLRAYNYWDFPKGVVEVGEEPLQAARREAAEEAAVTDLDFRWGQDFRDTEPYRGGKVARYYVAATSRKEISLPVNPELGRAEHHEYRWLTFRDARTLLVPRLVAVIDWAHELTGC